MKRKQVVLAYSGGVDSTAAGLLLKEEGYDVIAVTFDFLGDKKLLETAAATANKAGLVHDIVDCRAAFKARVIEPFVADYCAGKTPNPCVICDRDMKFEALCHYGDTHGIKHLATGHYLKIGREKNAYFLQKSPADRKDQSYYLYTLKQETLGRLLFPLSNFETKAAVRAYLKTFDITLPENTESQGICFIKKGTYGDFIAAEDKRRAAHRVGCFRDKCGKILGHHRGFYHYTLGQRRGLSVKNNKGYVVTAIEPETGDVILGEEQDLFTKTVFLKDLTFQQNPGEWPRLPLDFYICRWGIRYRGILKPLGENSGYIECTEPVRAPMPGQSAVFYTAEDRLIGGGIIQKKIDF